jgi:tetratricopeptide (TPR) repeat protein
MSLTAPATSHFAASLRPALAALVVALAAGAATDRAHAAATVIGSGPGRLCYEKTAAGLFDDEALEACDAALGQRDRLSPKDYMATLSNRGVMHLRRREGEAALVDFAGVLAMDERNAEAHLNSGAAYVMLRRHGEAVASITTALRFGVAEPHKAYFNRASAREALGDVRGAYEDYNTALTIRPDWGPAEAELARFARYRRETLAARLAERAADETQQ